MKTRKLADAAIVAAMLMTSIPGLAGDLTPADLLAPVPPAVVSVQTPDPPDDPAPRELS